MTRPLRRALLALLCLALCGGLLAACGGDEDESPTELLQQTFNSSAGAIENGRLNARFQLDPEGLLALGGPVRLALTGPFQAPRNRNLPRFDVDFVATLAGQRFPGSVLSTGRRAYVRLDGRDYRVDDSFVAQLRQGLRAVDPDKPQAGLRALGIDPLRWIRNAKEKGTERVGGVETIRIGGDVNVARLLEDIDRLLTKAGGAGGPSDLLSPALRKQIADAVDSAKVDVWTGEADKLLRQLAVRVAFAFKRGQTPIEGLEAGTINLRLRLDAVNETTLDLTAPSDARPLERLTGGSIGTFLDGIGEGLSSGSSGLAGGEFVRCITAASGNTATLVRCISKLAK